MYYEYDFLNKHNGIYIENTWSDNNISKHSYPFMMLVYIAHGTGIFEINAERNCVSEGDVVLINSHAEHAFYSSLKDQTLGVYCCCFFEREIHITKEQCKEDFPELSGFFDGAPKYVMVQDTSKHDIRNYIIRMLDDFIYCQPGYEYTIRSLLTVTVVMVFRLRVKERIKKTPVNSNVIVGAVTNYVNKNIYKKFSITDIASILHLSPDYICRVFKKNTNISFSQFLINSRVDKIKDALENTDRPIYLICEKFEFTPQYINKMFKKATGYSMAEYKKKFNYKSDNSLYNL